MNIMDSDEWEEEEDEEYVALQSYDGKFPPSYRSFPSFYGPIYTNMLP